MISLAEVTDKRRKPGVSCNGQPKDNIRSNLEVTPRAALEDVTHQRKLGSYNKRDDWTWNSRSNPAVVRPASPEDTGFGVS